MEINAADTVSIDPLLWGSVMWSSMHWIAAAYPNHPTQADKMYYKSYFENLQHTLPCMDCREHYTQLLKQMPIDAFLVSGKQLRQWVASLHNSVNARNNKIERWTLADVDRKYPPVSTKPQEHIVPENHQVIYVPPIKLQNVSRAMRQKQNLIQNNARIMGRVQKFTYAGASSLRVRAKAIQSRVQSKAPSAGAPIQIKKKKKGCGCNNKKR